MEAWLLLGLVPHEALHKLLYHLSLVGLLSVHLTPLPEELLNHLQHLESLSIPPSALVATFQEVHDLVSINIRVSPEGYLGMSRKHLTFSWFFFPAGPVVSLRWHRLLLWGQLSSWLRPRHVGAAVADHASKPVDCEHKHVLDRAFLLFEIH